MHFLAEVIGGMPAKTLFDFVPGLSGQGNAGADTAAAAKENPGDNGAGSRERVLRDLETAIRVIRTHQ
jgi:hypothetical protein